jgi:hypothetical protein
METKETKDTKPEAKDPKTPEEMKVEKMGPDAEFEKDFNNLKKKVEDVTTAEEDSKFLKRHPLRWVIGGLLATIAIAAITWAVWPTTDNKEGKKVASTATAIKTDSGKDKAKAKVDEEAKVKADEETKVKADEEAKVKADKEAKAKADEEAKVKADEEAKVKADKEAKVKADEEAKVKADEEAKVKADEEAKVKADEEAKVKTAAEEAAKVEATTEADDPCSKECVTSICSKLIFSTAADPTYGCKVLAALDKKMPRTVEDVAKKMQSWKKEQIEKYNKKTLKLVKDAMWKTLDYWFASKDEFEDTFSPEKMGTNGEKITLVLKKETTALDILALGRDIPSPEEKKSNKKEEKTTVTETCNEEEVIQIPPPPGNDKMAEKTTTN